MAIKIRWSNLLNLTDLDFEPGPPNELWLGEEIIQTIAWLTAATLHDRRLLRCTNQGALLVGNAWDNLVSVATDELHPDTGSADSYSITADNKGILIATSGQIIKASLVRVSGGAAEVIYIPPETLYFYPYKTVYISLNVVPDPGGTASYVGVTVFN